MKKRQFDDYILKHRKSVDEKRLTKLNKKKKKLFTLDEISIRKILDNNIKVKYPNLSYKLDKSTSTNSYYIMFFYGDRYVTARISDHESKVGAKGIVVNELTTKADVLDMLESRIKDVKYKYKAHLFNMFKDIGRQP